MNVSLGGALRLVFQPADDRSPDVTVRGAARIPRIDFVAYGEECILSGRIPMGAERLTDALNDMVNAGQRIAGLQIEGRWVDVRDPEVLSQLEAGKL